jgi:GntR family transcriptional regulator
MARRMNLEVSFSDLHVEQIDADPKTADGLCIEAGKSITRVRRVIRADGRPVAYLIDCLPEEILKPGNLPADFSGSVLDFLIGSGSDLKISRADISATNASAEVAKPLEIQRDDVLLRFESQLYDSQGKVLDYSVSYFIPGYFHFHVNRRVGSA